MASPEALDQWTATVDRLVGPPLPEDPAPPPGRREARAFVGDGRSRLAEPRQQCERRDWRQHPDEVVFRVVPAAGGGWPAVIAALSRKLASESQEAPQCLILSRDDGPGFGYFAQFLVLDEGVRSEVVANRFIPSAADQLDDAQLDLLDHLGWSPPDDGVAPNHWRWDDHPVTWDELATRAAMTLQWVYGIDERDQLTLTTFPGQ